MKAFELLNNVKGQVVETTTNGNGYPENLKRGVIVTATNRAEVEELLKSGDFVVAEIQKKEGQQLWWRVNESSEIDLYNLENSRIDNVTYNKEEFEEWAEGLDEEDKESDNYCEMAEGEWVDAEGNEQRYDANEQEWFTCGEVFSYTSDTTTYAIAIAARK